MPTASNERLDRHERNDSHDEHATSVECRRLPVQIPTLTHILPFVFFSGISLHTLLQGQTPRGWQWSERDELLLEQLIEAVMEDIPAGTVKGWLGLKKKSSSIIGGGSEGQGHDRSVSSSTTLVQASSDSEDGVKKQKKRGRKKSDKKVQVVKAQPGKSGRFDILGSSMA